MTYDWYKTFIIYVPPLFRVAGCGTVFFSFLWGERRKDYTQPRINILKNRFGKLSRVEIVTVNRSSCKLMIRAEKSKC
jgi:hypothetical protein